MIAEATSFVSLTANMEPSEDRFSLNIGNSSGVVILAQFSDLYLIQCLTKVGFISISLLFSSLFLQIDTINGSNDTCLCNAY